MANSGKGAEGIDTAARAMAEEARRRADQTRDQEEEALAP